MNATCLWPWMYQMAEFLKQIVLAIIASLLCNVEY